MSPDFCSICNSPRSNSAGPCSVCGAPPLTSTRNLPAGTHLQNGKFTLGRVLGEGGFGITYLGAHRYLKRTVAIKELFPERAMRHGTTISVPDSQKRDFNMEKERVLDEARVISRLNSPHIVGVHDAFLENNTAYIVMEYLEGRSLQERIEAEGSLPPDEVHRIAMAACDALTEVHRQDLLHRDIKPANIMLTRDGRVVLVDFGSARMFDHGQTVRHTRILTMDYAAPEMYSTQARFGPYTDLFCLGGTLFHALTGRQPPSVMDRLQGGSVDLEFPETLQGPLSAAIHQALQIAVEDRPPSAAAFKSTCAEIAVPRPAVQTVAAPAVEQVWSPATTSLSYILRGHTGGVWKVDFSPDGQILASSGSDDRSSVCLWDVDTGNLCFTLKVHGGEVGQWFFTSHGRFLASFDMEGTVCLWDVNTGALHRILERRRNEDYSVALSNDGRILARGGEGKTVRLWDTASRTLRCTLEGCRNGVEHMDFSPDDRTLAGVGGDLKSIHLWDVVTGELCYTLKGHGFRRTLRSLDFSPDGRTVAGSGDGRTVFLWDVATGELRRTIKGDAHELLVVFFGPGSRTLTSLGDDMTIRLWDVITGELCHTINGPGSVPFGMTFSPDGRTLARGESDDTTVRLWDVATGELHHTLEGHRDGIHWVDFSPNGKLLACGGGEGSIYLWNGAGGV